MVFDKIFTTRYVYQEPAGFLRWAIAPTTVTIAGYSCQRATATLGGRTWEAWFTRAVPVPEGPYKFCDLPGLIVKVGDTRGRFVYELQRVQQLPQAGAKTIGKPSGRQRPTTTAAPPSRCWPAATSALIPPSKPSNFARRPASAPSVILTRWR